MPAPYSYKHGPGQLSLLSRARGLRSVFAARTNSLFNSLISKLVIPTRHHVLPQHRFEPCYYYSTFVASVNLV
jgi:neutral trehalase